MSRGTADFRAKAASRVDVPRSGKAISLILLVGLVLCLFFAWEYDTGFASGYAPGYVYNRWFIGGLTELLRAWLQDRVLLFSLLAVVAFLLVRGPSYRLASRTRSAGRP